MKTKGLTPALFAVAVLVFVLWGKYPFTTNSNSTGETMSSKEIVLQDGETYTQHHHPARVTILPQGDCGFLLELPSSFERKPRSAGSFTLQPGDNVTAHCDKGLLLTVSPMP